MIYFDFSAMASFSASFIIYEVIYSAENVKSYAAPYPREWLGLVIRAIFLVLETGRDNTYGWFIMRSGSFWLNGLPYTSLMHK